MTHSNLSVLSTGGEEFAIRGKTYAPDIQITGATGQIILEGPLGSLYEHLIPLSSTTCAREITLTILVRQT